MLGVMVVDLRVRRSRRAHHGNRADSWFLGLMVFQQLHPQMAEKEDRKTASRLPMPSAALGRLLLPQKRG